MGSKPTHVRSRARSWVLQFLYAWDVTGKGAGLREFADGMMAHRRVAERYRPHIDRLLDILEERSGKIDSLLERRMPNWRLERLAVIDRNILRIGTAELLYAPDVPGRVAISEAIRLAEKYGSDDSPRFVNGVLDAIYQNAAIGR